MCAGMAHNKYAVSKWKAIGVGMLPSEAGLAVVESVVEWQRAHAPVLGAVPEVYWRAILPGLQTAPHLYRAVAMRVITAPAQQQSEYQGAASAAQASGGPAVNYTAANVEAIVRRVASSVLGVAELDANKPLALQGLDSLAGLELRHKIQVHASPTRSETVLHPCMFDLPCKNNGNICLASLHRTSCMWTCWA